MSHLNNLAHAHGMRLLFQFGFYMGTSGPYHMNALRRVLAGQSSLRRDEPGGGEKSGEGDAC